MLRRAYRPHSGRPAFTLVEMLTVVAIIALILGMAIPSFSDMWEDRKLAGAITTMHGVLRSTRARAMHQNELGLFFYIDPHTKRQRIVPIEPDPPDDDPLCHEFQTDCGGDPNDLDFSISDCVTAPMAEYRYRVVAGDAYELPAPVRVAPRSILDFKSKGKPLWTDLEIAHDSYNVPVDGGRPLHRNFFTIIFGSDGRMVVGQPVIIRDIALRNPDTGEHFAGAHRGYRTGLRVHDPTDYYTNDVKNPDETESLDPVGSKHLFDIIVDAEDETTALNFTSVGGLLVYDESQLADQPYEEDGTLKREFLVAHGQPIYVSRLTGEILEGPDGENK